MKRLLAITLLNVLLSVFTLYKVYRVESTQAETNQKMLTVLNALSEGLGLTEAQFKIIGEELWKGAK